jgi:CP family cyanate transporter-like MFS transporter
MNRSIQPGEVRATPSLLVVLPLLWLAGATIRIPLLADPPVIRLIHDDLHMSETQVGLLMGMPLAMFALAAVPGSLLIARFGVLAVATCGLAIATFAAAARAAAGDILTLYAMTLLMGGGVAIFQPALPTLVRLWAPARTWLANAVSTNGMLMGVTMVAALSIPVVLPAVGGSWRRDLLVWCVPGLVTVALFVFVAPRSRPDHAAANGAQPRWWPDWKSSQLWLLGIALGSNNACFFASNAFVPDYLTSIGRSDMIGSTLACLNGSQIIGSFLMLTMPERLQRQSWPFLIFGPVTMLGLIGIVMADGIWILVSASAAGLGAAVTFIVTFGLPAVLSPPGEVHRMAGGMFTISYGIALIVPVICGACWDLTGRPWTSFLPMVVCALGMTVFGIALTMQSARRQSAKATQA